MTMNKYADRSLILDSMPVKQALIRLAVPSILASMVTTIYNIADTFFIGQLHNTAMIAATTVAMPIMMLTHAFGVPTFRLLPDDRKTKTSTFYAGLQSYHPPEFLQQQVSSQYTLLPR